MTKPDLRVVLVESALRTEDRLKTWYERQPSWLDQCAWHALVALLEDQNYNAVELGLKVTAEMAYKQAQAMLARKRELESGGAL